MIAFRRVRRTCSRLFACALLACQVYDPALVAPSANDASQTQADADPRMDSCRPAVEVCNRIDDDCDGTVDEEIATRQDCATRVLHATSMCVDGACVYLRTCDIGYFNCDGRPDNGCESSCPCTGCRAADDAGDDAGN